MTPLKMQFDSETGEMTIFVGAARETVVIAGSDSEAAPQKAEQLFKLFRFAYSQGVTDAERLLRHKSPSLFDELILER